MHDEVPKVGFTNGRVVAPDGVPLVWLPRNGQVIAKLPARKGNRRWLHESVQIRSPRLDHDRWVLPRSCLTRLVTAATDKYGHVVVCRDMSKLSRCHRTCQEAQSLDCDCACLGVYHGADSSGWFERVGDVDVLEADRGEIKRTINIYSTASVNDTGPALYRGELRRRPYRADRRGRRDWPKAAMFMCACCLNLRARVWDHCHTHGFVRAPLCNTCNTRHWRGWHPRHGRVAPSANLDPSYYRWCPLYGDKDEAPCSA